MGVGRRVLVWGFIVIGIWAILKGTARVVRAQQLPLRCYGVSDGLAHSSVRALYQDSKGYLWIGTWDGLTRLDGVRFVSYHEADGLGHRIINDIAEDRGGRLWVATNGGGVARLNEPEEEALVKNSRPVTTRDVAARPQRSPRDAAERKAFVSYSLGGSSDADQVNRILFDERGRLWCATDGGLHRGIIGPTGDVTFEAVVSRGGFHAALADRRGHLWFGGTADALIEVVHDRIIAHPVPRALSGETIVGLLEDRPGRLLIAVESGGLFEFIPPTDPPHAKTAWRRLPLRLAPGQRIKATLLADAVGTLWIGTNKGLIKHILGDPTRDTRTGQWTLYTTASGLSHDDVRALGRDREGGLWVGTESGLCRLSGEAIISITKAEGLPDPYVWRIVESQDGRIYASTGGGIAEIVQGKARRVSGSQSPPFDHVLGRVLQDRRGDWWIGTHEALFRFRGQKLRLYGGRRFARELGLSPYGITYEQGMYEDATGHLWISTWTGAVGPRLFRFDPATTRFHAFDLSSFWPGEAVLKMMRDRSGALWLATTGGLGRIVNGRVQVMELTPGLPELRARALFEDRRGWVWVGLRYRGVSVMKDPRAQRPTFVNYSTRDGLSSDSISCITADDEGRIYLGTSRGLNQLDPETGRIRHFRKWDGLAGDAITDCVKDRQGNIWIGTTSGVSRYDPRMDRSDAPSPPIYLSRVHVAGEDLSVPERGVRWLPERRFRAGQNNIRIEYSAVSFRAGRALRYQYKLEGADADWSAPTEERSVTYARLAPGTYRFLVRAVDPQGASTSEPAGFAFVIAPPMWQRGWFIALMALVIGALIYAVHRYHTTRLVELERVRTRLAADLHDDIGASLSEIALLSELVREQKSLGEATARRMLAEIADTARDLVDTMSDIVWAINPRRDDLPSLILRIREMASETLGTRGIACDVQVPETAEAIKLAPDQRRHLYLIFKEALTNIVRHARCTEAKLSLRVENRYLIAEIRDNGCGFDPTSGSRGHGLENMRLRAAELKGRLQIESEPGRGTRLTLIAPLR